ncbi:MAG: NfeD family protein [Oscillospiraceae bacterium]|nr:NfeD family protein [Oscillospiraceae bacterium]
MDLASIIWLGLLVVFLIVEAACPIHLVSLWFAAGALVAAIASMLGAAVWLQVGLFLVVSVSLLVGLWPFTKKFLKPRISPTNVDANIGARCYVTAAVDNLSAQGQIKLNGLEWTARSTTGETIPEGTLVQVDRIEGVKAFVTPVQEEVNV